MQKIPCHCDNVFEVDSPDELDLEKNPGVYEEILDGTFQNATCPRCGTLLKPELQVRLKDKTRNLDLLFLPEFRRSDVLNDRLEEKVSALVVGYPELAERIRLLNEGIDPRAVEILKFFLKKKIGNDDASAFFAKKEDGFLVFHVTGLKEDQVAVTRLPENVYRSTLESLDQRNEDELYRIILTPPYISANKVSILEEEE